MTTRRFVSRALCRAILPAASVRATAQSGMQDLGAIGGFSSETVTVSSDGSVVVGNPYNAASQQHAFRWTEPCLADFDEDGFITGVDFDLFVAAYEAGC